jgi:hypothetical protein
LKDQYVGDVNDYVKYALLRSISDREHRLGVVWMLTAPDERADGSRLAYLTRPERFRHLDPALFDGLAELITSGRRSVRDLQEARLLPHAIFFSAEMDNGPAARADYIERAINRSAGAAFVFFDPDNGVEVPSVKRGRRGSARYVYWDELGAFFARGHSLVVYQHFPRRPRLAFLERLGDAARYHVGGPGVLALTTPHVAFLLLPQAWHWDRLSACLDAVCERAAPFAARVVTVGA